MALPFLMPRDDATEEQYRRLEQLLSDLYAVLRALLTGGATPVPPWTIFQHHPPPPPPASQGPPHPRTTPSVQSIRRMPLVNVSQPRPSGGPHSSNQTPPAAASKLTYWSGVGRELRDIADQFRTRGQHAVPV